MSDLTIRPAYSKWPDYQRHLRDVVAVLTDEQLAIHPSPERWPYTVSRRADSSLISEADVMSITNKHRILGVVRAAPFLAVTTIVTACDNGPVGPTTTSPPSTMTARLATGPTLVPMKGTFESRALPPSAQSCPAGSFRTNGAGDGIVSHLGRMTQTITGCLNPVTLTSSGSAVFTAANGDQLYLSVSSAIAPGGSPGGRAACPPRMPGSRRCERPRRMSRDFYSPTPAMRCDAPTTSGWIPRIMRARRWS